MAKWKNLFLDPSKWLRETQLVDLPESFSHSAQSCKTITFLSWCLLIYIKLYDKTTGLSVTYITGTKKGVS